MAEVIGTSPDKLVAAPAAKQSALDTVADLVTATKRFGDLVQRFALAQRISPNMAQTMLRTRMLTTVQRGREPEVEQMLDSLEALVRALETS
jgi:antitoxin (DNA-binding transcriptional repressor) of toxin-antitoxin stability system